ncbi:uncharacterized protein LOC110850030 isoform X2 [Folsomia candida]|uniref:Uncharacterized protein n=1 Tax=Folsomia candida TaxID=158441 RepID=A0A226E8H0_FOLCA|nr:uncharacterized protein LOC110850030 isoform X2 [Folsomia candida]OXA53779.1 hypothetical protein Fcan01_11896 [Folsomia candida]
MNFAHLFAVLTFFEAACKFTEMQTITENSTSCVERTPFCLRHSDCCGHRCVPFISHIISATTVYNTLVNVGLRGESQFDLSSLRVCSTEMLTGDKVSTPDEWELEKALSRTIPPEPPSITGPTPAPPPPSHYPPPAPSGPAPEPAPPFPGCQYPQYPNWYPKTLQRNVAMELEKFTEFVPTACRPYVEDITKIFGPYANHNPVEKVSYGDDCAADAHVDKETWAFVY